MSLVGHLKALMLKNWLLWRRELCGSLCELLFPIILMIFLYLIKIAIGTSDEKGISYLYDSMVVGPYKYTSNQTVTDLLKVQPIGLNNSHPFEWCKLLPGWKMAVVNQSGDGATVMEYVITEIKNFFNETSSIDVLYYNTTKQLEDYVESSRYGDNGRICFAVEIDSISNKSLVASIRYNMTSTDPSDNSVYGTLEKIFSTDLFPSVNKYQKNVITDYQTSFVQSGFLTIQNLLINSIIHQINDKGKLNYPDLVNVFVPMHGQDYIQDNFMTNLSGTLGFFMFVTSLVPVCRMISKVVTEKESKVREAMKMMGLKDTPYWLSWFIMYSLIYFIIALFSMFISFGIFKYSNKFIVFLMFFLYGQSCLAFSVLISAIFNKAKTAVLVGMLAFFVSYFSQLSITTNTSSGVLGLMSLLNTVAMSQGFQNMMLFEGSQIGIDFSNIGDSYYNYSVSIGLTMLFVDSILYWLFALYLDKVIKTETGVSLRWYFPFTLSYWKGHTNKDVLSAEQQDLIQQEEDARRAEMRQNQNIEEIEPSLKAQIDTGVSMKVRGLRKHFGDKVAVDGLDLDMFKGQIFALLGHNGAGKTTTISMLTGMLAPTAGEMTVNNLNFSTDMTEIRKQLGVCPQHDILYKSLTVEEHLYLFCRFKGIQDKNTIQAMIDEKISDIDLQEKRNTKAGNLSGGQKRKLSLAIALIGGSSIVMLDEPTSGMDLTARRKMWDMLKTEKRSRIIILTTHYMEEADILADRIAIMSQGKLYCLGSPLFLKKRFGVGYNLSIVKAIEGAKQPDFTKIQALVSRHLPESKVFNTASAEILFEIPLESTYKFKNFFIELDANAVKLNIETYGISVTTLEEVFIRVSRGDEGGAHDKILERTASETKAIESIPSPNKFDSEMLNSDDFNIAEHRVKGVLFFSHFLALIEKRIIYSKRDFKGICLEICLPITFVILGLVLLTQFSIFNNQGSYILSFSKYDEPQSIVFGYNGLQMEQSDYLNIVSRYREAQEVDSMWGIQEDFNEYGHQSSELVCDDKTYPSCFINQNPSLYSDALVSQINESNLTQFDLDLYNSRDVSPFRLGSYYVFNRTDNFTGVYVFSNSSGIQSPAVYAAEYGSAYLNAIYNQTYNQTYSLTMYNHPLPLTSVQKNLAQNAGSFFVALIFAIGMAFIPTGLVTFIVKERENNIKHQHLVSGVSIPAYWLSAYSWDLLKYLLPGIISPLMIKVFNLKAMSDPQEVYNAVWSLFILFGFAICPYTYSLSFAFKSYSVAQFVVFLMNLIVGVIGALAVWILIIISDTTRNIANVLVYPFRIISPIFCLSFGLMTVANRDAYQSAYGLSSEPGPFDWDITGANIFFLFLHTVIGTAVVFAIEFLSNVTFFRNLTAARDPGPGEYKDDDDVERIRQEARNASPNDVAVKVSGLRKIYGNLFNKKDVKIAVQDVSFVLPRQQAFALLGVNGAGKTSTFRILTGEYGPTSGEAYISGHNVVTELSKARYNIGYCPQFDALSEVLTPPEHLKLYARIKGIPKHLIKTFVDKQMHDMGLEKYAKVQSRNLSGGNKRKLSVAIATIGNPPVVFLDEPSAGMDPNARKNMWEVVNRIKRQKCSIILTTHSMDEAESLCNTMAIMVGGRFKCYGTATHIKNKYSSGYEFLLKVLFPTPEQIQALVSSLIAFTIEGTIASNLVSSAISSIGYENLFERIADHESGAHLHEELKESGKIEVKSLAEWILLENIGDEIYGWLVKEFKEVKLIEHYGSYYKFKLEKNQNYSIGYLFGMIEDVKDKLKINEYSLSQTTLEQIFNMFATESDAPKSKMRLSMNPIDPNPR